MPQPPERLHAAPLLRAVRSRHLQHLGFGLTVSWSELNSDWVKSGSFDRTPDLGRAPPMEERPRQFLLLISLLALLPIPSSIAASGCRKSTTIAGFEANLAMVQLRGVVRVLDGCSFSVRKFDMLAGSAQVRWWGAAGLDLRNLTLGSPISDQTLNRASRNESLTVRLADNVTWGQIAVLAVWDPATASDFGHVILGAPGADQSEVLLPSADLSPAPSPSSSSVERRSKRRIRCQPTMFDNCLTLSSRYRLRWTFYPESDSIDIGLEAAVGSQYMAFGWAVPGSPSPSMMIWFPRSVVTGILIWVANLLGRVMDL